MQYIGDIDTIVKAMKEVTKMILGENEFVSEGIILQRRNMKKTVRGVRLR